MQVFTLILDDKGMVHYTGSMDPTTAYILLFRIILMEERKKERELVEKEYKSKKRGKGKKESAKK